MRQGSFVYDYGSYLQLQKLEVQCTSYKHIWNWRGRWGWTPQDILEKPDYARNAQSRHWGRPDEAVTYFVITVQANKDRRRPRVEKWRKLPLQPAKAGQNLQPDDYRVATTWGPARTSQERFCCSQAAPCYSCWIRRIKRTQRNQCGLKHECKESGSNYARHQPTPRKVAEWKLLLSS